MVTIQRSRRSSKPAPSSIRPLARCTAGAATSVPRCCVKRSSPNSELFGRQLTTRSSTRSSTTRFGEPALMGTDGNAIAGASEPRCVTGDRFEDRINHEGGGRSRQWEPRWYHCRHLKPSSSRVARPAEVGKRSTDAQIFLRRLGRRNLTKKGSKIFPRTYFLCFTQKRVQFFFASGEGGAIYAPSSYADANQQVQPSPARRSRTRRLQARNTCSTHRPPTQNYS